MADEEQSDLQAFDQDNAAMALDIMLTGVAALFEGGAGLAAKRVFLASQQRVALLSSISQDAQTLLAAVAVIERRSR